LLVGIGTEGLSSKLRSVFILCAFVLVVAVAIGFTAISPLHAWRDPIYIVAGFGGVIAISLMLFQPMLAAGFLPGLSVLQGRQVHRYLGTLLVVSVVIHVAGLWITSPPDVIDALLFSSPTPFSVWGVIAMWAVFVAACLGALRRKLRLSARIWRLSHRILVTVTVMGSVAHALLIEGAMETFSKLALCGLLLITTVVVLLKFKQQG